MKDSEWDELVADVKKIGREHGKNAAAWWQQDGIGSRANGDTKKIAESILNGLADGDPEILDSLPQPDLSGQWVDGYSSKDLHNDLGFDDDAEIEGFDYLCDEYETAFRDAAWEAIEKYCRQENA